jgi:hypothetical protein
LSITAYLIGCLPGSDPKIRLASARPCLDRDCQNDPASENVIDTPVITMQLPVDRRADKAFDTSFRRLLLAPNGPSANVRSWSAFWA